MFLVHHSSAMKPMAISRPGIDQNKTQIKVFCAFQKLLCGLNSWNLISKALNFPLFCDWSIFFLFACSESDRANQSEKRKEKNAKRGGGSRFEPYASPSKRYRAFITNIPFDVKWQYLKDLVKEKGKLLWVCLSCVGCPYLWLDFPCPEIRNVSEVILGRLSHVEQLRFFLRRDPSGVAC